MKKIILCGYMGSGKTTTARLLAKTIGIDYLDLDEIIEKNTGKTVSQLFEEEGEIKFRLLEHQTLKEVVEKNTDFVLALGGGTPCYANNHLLLQHSDVVSVYLKTGIDEVIRRVTAQGNTRPLLAGKMPQELKEFVGQHIFERSYFYNHAQYTVVTDAKTPEIVAEEILRLI
ncbi:shikimate kinase [Flavobacterium sp. RNTU_13]|uniref:shikimate kinase n=1 Tax=Flavobacterium sp. RNTU_13 TaxID=3375145 RepID=UPI00398881D9